MIGCVPTNLHEGSRSEYLAQYVFAAFGTSVPVPHQEDSGLDLHCTLMEQVGTRSWARSVYAVQVKSGMEPWAFEGSESVRWLIQYPLPLFLSVVEKHTGIIRVYHTSARFLLWSLVHMPNNLSLTPEEGEVGKSTEWEDGTRFSLGAPIVQIGVTEIQDKPLRQRARDALARWIGVDEANLLRVRQGLRQFTMPGDYRTNSVHSRGEISHTRTIVGDPEWQSAARGLLEPVEWLATSAFRKGDLDTAARAAVLHRHLVKKLADPSRDGGGLWQVLEALNRLKGLPRRDYLFAGLDCLNERFSELLSVMPVADETVNPAGGLQLEPPAST